MPKDTPPARPDRLPRFRTPSVRHLYWMLTAPQLIRSDRCFCPGGHRTEEVVQKLHQWDADPASGPGVLTAPPVPRLGLHFEQLYHCLLEELLGWEVLVRNLQIREQGRTLGELDFVVRNPGTGGLEHHEIAVKFYLGYPGPDGIRWYGPNAHDRLDLKTSRILNHQSHLTEHPQTRRQLAALGMNEPLAQRVFMPGYLFYPAGQPIPAPASAPEEHLRGQWVYQSSPGSLNSCNTRYWKVLHKPHWLGPWVQPTAPDMEETRRELDKLQNRQRPGLFSELAENPETGCWEEQRRLFVMPDHWPITH